MGSFLKRLYPALFVAVVFVVVGVTRDGFLDPIDYVATYFVYSFFYLPVLLERSIWEMIEIPRPRFVRQWVLTRRQKYLEKGPLNYNRITAVLLVILFLLLILAIPTAQYVGEVASVEKEELSDSSVIERLLLQAALLLSAVVALTLLASNLLRRGFVDWNAKKRSELSEDLPGCMHAVNIGFLIVVSPMLLISSRFGQFISGNFGFPVLLIVQGLIALILLPGDRWLRNQR